MGVKPHMPSRVQVAWIFKNAPSKEVWKKQVKEKVHKFWSTEIKEDGENKYTLLHLNPNPSFDKLHISIAIIDNIMP